MAQPSGSVATAVVATSAQRAWDLLTDVRAHARWIPATRVEAPARAAVGDPFVAVTGPTARRGGRGLPDRMVVERLEPPGRPGAPDGVAAYRKTGPVLLGTALLEVRPLGPTRCAVRWSEDVHLRGLPRALTAPLLRPVLGAMTRLALARARAELEGHRPRG